MPDAPITSPPAEGGEIITSPPTGGEDVITGSPENPQPPPDQPTEPDTELPVIGAKKTELDNITIQPNTDITVGKLSALQKAGFKLAIGVGSVITLVILVTLGQAIYLMFHPKTDSVLSSQDKFENVLKQNANFLNSDNADQKTQAEQAIKTARENVTEALQNDSTWNRITSLFDLVVVKALLPIFTTILGYIFGSRVGGDEQ